MSHKKWIIGIVFTFLLALLLCFYLLYENYQVGLELYGEVNTMSVQIGNIADSIAFLEGKMESGKLDIAHDRFSFDQAIVDVAFHRFGSEDMPLTKEVRSAWINRFDEIYSQSVANDTENKGLEKLLNEEAEELSAMRKTMENLTHSFMEFHERYNKMSFWQRCIFSWKTEIAKFSDLAGMP